MAYSKRTLATLVVLEFMEDLRTLRESRRILYVACNTRFSTGRNKLVHNRKTSSTRRGTTSYTIYPKASGEAFRKPKALSTTKLKTKTSPFNAKMLLC